MKGGEVQGVCLRDCASVHVTVEDESPSPPSLGPQMKIALPPPPNPPHEHICRHMAIFFNLERESCCE